MSTPTPDRTAADARGLDVVAVHAALRRLLRAPEPPWLHAEVARRMADRLAIIRHQPSLLLDWWSHLGASSELLAKAYPLAARIAVEPTTEALERSLEVARRPWWSVSRRAAPQVLSAGGELPAGAELIWANMMLHAVPEPPRLIERWHRLLAVDGFVMFSCLGPGTLRELREVYARLGWPTPTPGFIDMHDLGDMLVQAGFADPVMDQETLTLSWDGPERLLEELHSLGGNVAPARVAGLRTPRWRARLTHELAALAGPDGRIRMSFEVAYGHAFKAAPRARVADESVLSLQDMKSMLRSPNQRR